MLHTDETELLEIEVVKCGHCQDGYCPSCDNDYSELNAELRSHIRELQGMLDANAEMIGRAGLIVAAQTTRRRSL